MQCTECSASERLVMPKPEPSHLEPDPYIHAGGRCDSWRAMSSVGIAEFLGTAMLVLVAGEPIYAGLGVALIVQCLGCVSGAQLNPCVSLSAWWGGRMRGARVAVEVAAQVAGAAGGAFARSDPLDAVTRVAHGYPLYKAVIVEALCALGVVLANCAQWHATPNGGDHSWPLRIGVVVTALAVLVGTPTGGSMNPARSFGPALVANYWKDHWVYWAGPLSGAAAACLLHRLMLPRTPQNPSSSK